MKPILNEVNLETPKFEQIQKKLTLQMEAYFFGKLSKKIVKSKKEIAKQKLLL